MDNKEQNQNEVFLKENEKEEALRCLQGLLSIPSVNDEESGAQNGAPFGEEINNALLYILDEAAKMGFYYKNLDGYAGIIDLTVPDAEETVGILCHLDVVPPDGIWQSPPFTPTVRDGKIFARGAIDDKGPLVASLYAMKRIKDNGYTLSKNVRLICGTDEETGFRCVEYYKKHEPMPSCGFSPDGDFPVVFAEKGIAHFELTVPLYGEENILALSGGEAANIVPAVCCAKFSKSVCSSELWQNILSRDDTECEEDNDILTVKTLGKAAHASVPQDGKNAVGIMLGILSQLSLNEGLKNSLFSLYNLFGTSCDGSNSGLGFCDEQSGSMTLGANMISLCEKGIKLTFDMRYAVSDNFARIEKIINDICQKYAFEYNLLSHKEPLNAGRDSLLVTTLNRVYNEIMGTQTEPIAIGGGTYSRAFKNFVAFGPVFPGEKELAHMSNEFLSLDNFYKLIEIYEKAIYQLAK